MSDEEYKEHINGELNLGSSNYVNIKAKTVVTLYEQFIVDTEDGPQFLNVKISSDFDELPKKYHEIFLNVLTSKYLNRVSFGNNPFSECKPIVKRKWWQFWKTKYFMQMK
jgi:hypothetical protein